jgi:hypothetical protein
MNWLLHPLTRKIVERRLAAQTNQSWKNLAAFLDEGDTPEMRSLVTEAVTENRKIPNPERQLADIVKILRNQSLDRDIKALRLAISQPLMSDSDRERLNRREQELQAQKKADALIALKSRIS